MESLEALRHGDLEVTTIEAVLAATHTKGRLQKIRAAIMEGVATRIRELQYYWELVEASGDIERMQYWEYEITHYVQMYFCLENNESCTFSTPPSCEITNGSTVCIPASIGDLRKERAVIWWPYNKS